MGGFGSPPLSLASARWVSRVEFWIRAAGFIFVHWHSFLTVHVHITITTPNATIFSRSLVDEGGGTLACLCDFEYCLLLVVDCLNVCFIRCMHF